MKTYLFSILATLLVAVGCTVDEPVTPNEPEPKPDPTPEVVITDFENEDTTVKDTINSALMKVPGSKSYNNDYLSSTELDALNVYDMMVWALYIPTEGISKTAGISFRAVLAF